MQLIKQASQQKLRGGFYTPEAIVSFILKWAFQGTKKADVLEPSCGDGVFLRQIKQYNYDYRQLTAIELDHYEAEKAQKIGLKKANFKIMDFHQFCVNSQQKFDLVIGNPPYIRYQYFDKQQQCYAADIFNQAQLNYSKLTNAWVSFVVGSSLLLKQQGKLGFVLPAEILQVSYAKALREFLAHFYNKIYIISFEKLVFPDIQQEVVLLLCEKNHTKSHSIDHLELKDLTELEQLDLSQHNPEKKIIDFKSNKWTFYFLNQKEIDFLQQLQQQCIPKLGAYATVEVGITTGANPFFTVPLSVVNAYDLDQYAKPLVGRSVQVPSVIFTLSDWQKNRDIEARTHLLTFPKMSQLNGSIGARQYIAWGETQKIHQGYKCRIRDEWQIVPSLKISDALFIRRNNLYPKLIINEAQAFTTDTMHRVNVLPNTKLQAFTASYYNSLSLAFAEICGRSHGGGVLELMPNEVEDILLPYDENNAELLPIINQMIRDKQAIQKILKLTNRHILKNNLGFSDREIELIDGIWKKLSHRRLNRGKKL